MLNSLGYEIIGYLRCNFIGLGPQYQGIQYQGIKDASPWYQRVLRDSLQGVTFYLLVFYRQQIIFHETPFRGARMPVR